MDLTMAPDDVARLATISGLRLEHVIRWLFRDDNDKENYEQAADGPTLLIFESAYTLEIEANPEQESIRICANIGDKYGESYQRTEVSNNDFWANRIGHIVTRVEVLKSCLASDEYPLEFGLQLWFDNGLSACVEYVNTESSPDTLRVRESVADGDHEKIRVGQVE